jgi:Fic family protein
MGQINDIINEITVAEDVKEYLYDVEQEYLEYLKLLQEYGEDFTKQFLRVYREEENIVSNSMENKHSQLSAMFHNQLTRQSDPVQRAVEAIKHDYTMTVKELHSVHSRIMKTDPRDYIERGKYRKNQAHVGYFTNENGERVGHIIYTPPAPEEIPGMMQEVLDFYNACTPENEQLAHPFIQAAVAHALILHVQPYMDGNSRTARVLHHAKIWQHAHENYGINIESPALFLSKQFGIDRKGYRGKINKIDQRPLDNTAWNEWFYNMMGLMFTELTRIRGEIGYLKKMYDSAKRR